MADRPPLTVYIAAPVPVVFRYFVDPEAIVQWMGERADLDPRPGGRFALDIRGAAVRGTFLDVEPPHRLLISWGYASDNPLAPGASTVEIRLRAEGTGTRVELEHHDLPADQQHPHHLGWSHYLPRLAEAASGRTPPTDPGMPTHPALPTA